MSTLRTVIPNPFEERIVRVGMGGWDLPPFSRIFYPAKTRKGFRKLEYYSQFFDLVEVNVTFYRTDLTREQVLRWTDDVSHNSRFVFTVKLFQGFTHTLTATRDDVRSVRRMLDTLAERNLLGGLMMQFPYSFINTPDRRGYLLRLARAFDSYSLFAEFRHDSWNSPLTFNFLQEEKVRLTNVDLPAIKRHMPFTCEAWGGASYFRMMGRNRDTWDARALVRGGATEREAPGERYDYFYSENELGDLARRINHASLSSAKTFVVFHNDPRANSLVNGFQLRRMLAPKKHFLVPDTLVASFPALKEFSLPVNTRHPLFAEEMPLLREAV